MISSPSFSVRATACASRKLSVVMLAPNAISSGREPVKSAPAWRARSYSASDSALVTKAPPRLAFEPRR